LSAALFTAMSKYTRSEINPLLVDVEAGQSTASSVSGRSMSTASVKQAMAFPDTLMLQQE